MTFKPVTVTADSTIENLYVQQRNCRFPNESNLEFFVGFYTNSLCMLECRLKLCLEFCGCVPHFYNTAVRLPVCPLKRLRCLVDNNGMFSNDLSSINLNLLICSKNTPKPRLVPVPQGLQLDRVHVAKLRAVRLVQGSAHQVGHGVPEGPVQSAHHIRLCRCDGWVLKFVFNLFSFSFLLIAVSTGGICGLFFGASFITVVELCYLFLRNILK